MTDFAETVSPDAKVTIADPLPLVLTIEEAARRLGVGRTVMFGLVRSGAVESVRIGRLRRVPSDALVTFLAELRAVVGRHDAA